ncbi:MAG: hypothetical protein JKY24_05815 [Pseudomonadales bacterium]|nr:hypothetical protein [Pseudomonadales bacterium]
MDTWQRCITALEDPCIADTALGGLDTTTRTQNVWQVKLSTVPYGTDPKDTTPYLPGAQWRPEDIPPESKAGKLQARVIHNDRRDLDNNFYRIEIHHNSQKDKTQERLQSLQHQQQFKWSRNNASAALSVKHMDNINPEHSANESELTGNLVINMKKEDTFAFIPGALVELTDDRLSLRQLPGILTSIRSVTNNQLQLNLSSDQINIWNQIYLNNAEYTEDGTVGLNRRLIQWDGIGTISPGWQNLVSFNKIAEPIQVRFSSSGDHHLSTPLDVKATTSVRDTRIDQEIETTSTSTTTSITTTTSDSSGDVKTRLTSAPPSTANCGSFMSGEYWNFSSRKLSADIDWPTHLNNEVIQPNPEPPHGPVHQYTCLTLMIQNAKGKLSIVNDYDFLPKLKSLTDTSEPHTTQSTNGSSAALLTATNNKIDGLEKEVKLLTNNLSQIEAQKPFERIDKLNSEINYLKNNIDSLNKTMKKHTELLTLISKKSTLANKPPEAQKSVQSASPVQSPKQEKPIESVQPKKPFRPPTSGPF